MTDHPHDHTFRRPGGVDPRSFPIPRELEPYMTGILRSAPNCRIAGGGMVAMLMASQYRMIGTPDPDTDPDDEFYSAESVRGRQELRDIYTRYFGDSIPETAWLGYIDDTPIMSVVTQGDDSSIVVEFISVVMKDGEPAEGMDPSQHVTLPLGRLVMRCEYQPPEGAAELLSTAKKDA